MKKYLPVFILVFVCFALSPVNAAAFKLNSIGALDVSQNLYSHMWYTGNQPAFSGSGTSGSAVDISVDANTYSTTVDTNGEWSWTPPQPLSSADHNLIFASGPDSITLTLTTGSDVPDDIKSSNGTSDVPVSGLSYPTILLFITGSVFVTLPFWQKYTFNRNN